MIIAGTNSGDGSEGSDFRGTWYISYFSMSPLYNHYPAATGLDLEPVNPLQMPVPRCRRKNGLLRSSNLRDIFYYGFVVGIISFWNCAVSIDTYSGGGSGHDCDKYKNPICDMVCCSRGVLFSSACFLLLLYSFTRRDFRDPVWVPSYFQNCYLYYGAIFPIVLLILTFYVPVLIKVVFKQHAITGEWGLLHEETKLIRNIKHFKKSTKFIFIIMNTTTFQELEQRTVFVTKRLVTKEPRDLQPKDLKFTRGSLQLDPHTPISFRNSMTNNVHTLVIVPTTFQSSGRCLVHEHLWSPVSERMRWPESAYIHVPETTKTSTIYFF
ncbi:hypothetical protein BDA99DRAFT_538381 [Phascolomyces articulosus]|uniref:Cation-transporting P-type ATPase C-terminal domain-containing protein n=1 Tax=Phascolomyces articulosus TaxID=60185 RepID=A0AAD5JXJ6_9FUNG|nr:hypothetical protein BDA99DRAFT_538381 [Phascolomyces articulosus]